MVDVIVVGAGPAGSVTAALLRRLGYHVEIWERATFPRHRIGESLPPRAVALLQHLKFHADGFAVMEGHTSIWGSERPHRAVFEEGYGLQVDRDRFDQLLLDQSAVTAQFGKTCTGIARDSSRVIGVRSNDGETHARFVVVATGPGKAERQLRQSATYGYWRNSRHPEGSQANDTIIESFADGWVWSLRLASGLRNVTVLSDAPRLSYLEAIGQTHFVKQMLEGADLTGKPSGCDASWQCAPTFAEPGMLLVGDAGSVIDPLSSQGVYKALCSAISASVVINTCLKRPTMEAAALEFFNEEERQTYDGYAAGSVSAFRAEQRWPERPFWKIRHELAAWDPRPKPFSAEIANAIESGNAMELRLQNSAQATIQMRPTMSGSFIELMECVVSEAFPYGYRGRFEGAFKEIHRSLSQPKPLREVTAGSLAPTRLLQVVGYMYREGLIETV